MAYLLERLTYVYEGSPGAVGKVVAEAGGVLRFGAEGSGLIDIHRQLQSLNPMSIDGVVVNVPITMHELSDASATIRALVQQNVPCIVGHAGSRVAVLVSSTSVRRSQGTMSDVRGKVRFGAARLDWVIASPPE